jgi:3-hydroxyisobutyrate dehydrogenase-like beta-hydroxyacid dehydrogenase
MSGLAIGVVGLGNIGGPIASRLAERFFVQGVDPAKDEGSAPPGVAIARDAGVLAREVDVVCMSLPTPQAVLATIGALAAVPSGERKAKVIVETSTVGVTTAERSAVLAREAGYLYVDAPVSGGVPRARNGTLAIMCAGDAQAIAAADPMLRQMAAKVFVMGERPGMGQAMKLANNIISAAAMAVTSEALIFGERHGLSPAAMIDVINVSTGRTEVSEVKFVETILPRNYRGAFARVMGQDVSLFIDGVSEAGLDAPVARRTAEVWDAFVQDEPMKDFQYLYEYLRAKSGASQ